MGHHFILCKPQLQISTTNLEQVGQTIEPEGIQGCKFWLNDTFSVSIDSQISFIAGEVYLHYELNRTLKDSLSRANHGLKLSQTRFVTDNNFPSRTVKFDCNEFVGNWSCKQKGDQCRNVLREISREVMISSYMARPYHKFKIMGK